MTAHPALPAVERAIREHTGTHFRLRSSTPLGGGCSHAALSVADAGTRYFVKIGGAEQSAQFEAEADGLAAIAASASLRTPAVVAAGSDERHAFLVLEHLELRPLQSADDGVRFAEALAQMHRTSGALFGWPRDNFIGRTPQPNAAAGNWSQFVVERRLRPQLALARANGFGAELQRLGERLCARLPALFLDYRPAASLVHGDLWHGNAGVLGDGTPVVFDPAVHHGDREADLAMSELFGGFPAAFYAAYRKAWPLHEDYERRKPLYSLYHMLNHLNLFGRAYLGETLRLATKLDHALSSRRDD